MILAAWFGCTPKIDVGTPRAVTAAEPVRVVARAAADAPNVYFAAWVDAGSARDPIGSEGLAALTARSLVEAGAGARDADAVRDALYPTGNGFEVVVSREWVSVRLRCHRDQAATCAELFVDALTQPRFDAADVERARDRAIHAVTDGLLGDEEALAAEVLDAAVYEGHPYGHPVDGRAGVLPLLDAADAAAFHRGHYVREGMWVGIAGGYDDVLLADLQRRLEAVPATRGPGPLALVGPAPITGRSLVAVDTDTPVTGVRFASPTALDRTSPDYPAMWVAVTALGAHRQSFGRMFGAMRADRGLNYGDYAYVEPYVERGSPMPEQGVLRQHNLFSVWIRPTSVENGPFAVKLAVDEVERWVDHGLTPEEFTDIRAYLRGSLPLLAPDPGRRLAYALDAAATGTPDPFETLPAALDALTVEEVNAAIPRNVDLDHALFVAVSGEAQALVDALTGEAPTPIVYAPGAADPANAERDAAVAARDLGLDPAGCVVVPAEGRFR